MKLPKIRENLLVQDLSNEILIYDLTTNKSYCLNETAKTVFNHCDGVKTFADINLPEDIIYLSLDQLKKHNLLEDDYASTFAGISRRDAIKKVGMGTMIALPFVVGITAPKAAQAASGLAQLGQPCNNNCVAPNQCTAQFGQGNVCRAPAGQTCSFSRPDLCTTGCCTTSPAGPVCCQS
jgi:hypothetical protein